MNNVDEGPVAKFYIIEWTNPSTRSVIGSKRTSINIASATIQNLNENKQYQISVTTSNEAGLGSTFSYLRCSTGTSTVEDY